jgi:hypothetical protein
LDFAQGKLHERSFRKTLIFVVLSLPLNITVFTGESIAARRLARRLPTVIEFARQFALQEDDV